MCNGGSTACQHRTTPPSSHRYRHLDHSQDAQRRARACCGSTRARSLTCWGPLLYHEEFAFTGQPPLSNLGIDFPEKHLLLARPCSPLNMREPPQAKQEGRKETRDLTWPSAYHAAVQVMRRPGPGRQCPLARARSPCSLTPGLWLLGCDTAQGRDQGRASQPTIASRRRSGT